MDKTTYYVRSLGSSEILGPFDIAEIKEQLSSGCLTSDREAIEATGQAYGQLQRAAGWTRIDLLVGDDVHRDKREPLHSPQTEPSVKLKPMKNSRFKWILISIAAIAAALFLMNPSQTAHLKAIRDTVSLRHSSNEIFRPTDLPYPMIKYHNYLLFSTATLGKHTLSYGYLRVVMTTNKITIFNGALDGLPWPSTK
jgi:hypothetical protein